MNRKVTVIGPASIQNIEFGKEAGPQEIEKLLCEAFRIPLGTSVLLKEQEGNKHILDFS